MAEYEGYRQGGAVGGDYAITGTLPTLDDLIAFKEGTAKFEHGYYRFVSHPLVRRLEDKLKRRFGCRYCKLTESLEIALLELILCLHKPGASCRIVVLKGEGAVVPFTSAEFLPACDREGISVLVLEPGNTDAWNNKGVCFRKLGKLEQALTCYDRATENDRRNASAWSNRGNCLYTLGRYAEALTDLVKAVDIDPKNESALLNKGLVEERLGRPSDAAVSYRAFLALNPVQYQAHVPFAKKRLALLKKH